jgi:hypothetical protein
MKLEFINSDGRFFKNVVFIGYKLSVYTGGFPCAENYTLRTIPSSYITIWRWKC